MKTGRRDWIYLLIFLPVIGAIAYFVREILPEIQTGVFMENVQRVIFPNGRINELEKQLRISDTEANKLNLAHELEKQKKYDKALELTKSCLAGIYARDTGIMQDVARLSFYNNQFDQCLTYYGKVLAVKQRFDKPEDELIYARALEGNGAAAKAEEEFLRIIRVHHSMEARYHYGMMLKKQNRPQEAKAQFKSILDEKDLHPAYVRRLNSQWIRLSRMELAGLR
jgi:hypothetical protein